MQLNFFTFGLWLNEWSSFKHSQNKKYRQKIA